MTERPLAMPDEKTKRRSITDKKRCWCSAAAIVVGRTRQTKEKKKANEVWYEDPDVRNVGCMRRVVTYFQQESLLWSE